VEEHDQHHDKSTRSVVQIDGEHELDNGWLYTISVSWEDGTTSDHEITFAWVDHENLVGGTVPPSQVVLAAGELAAAHFGSENMPVRCDVSSLRRHIPGFDSTLRSMI
jgi:hypothetical protein